MTTTKKYVLGEEKIPKAWYNLASDLPSPPVYAKVNPADAPVLTLAVTSKSEPLTKVHDMVDNRLAQKISQLPGVGLVSLEGGQKPGFRIRANPTALAAYGLNVDDLRTTITNANVNTPKGNFDGPTRAYTINANDQITDPEMFNDVIVAYRNGAPVRLREVASIAATRENTKLEAWVNSTQAVIVNVQRGGRYEKSRAVDRMIAAARETSFATRPLSNWVTACFALPTRNIERNMDGVWR